jgi:hypothetical protein
MTGRGPDRRPRRSGAQCAICGLWAGNSRDIPVHRYRLQRSQYESGRQRSQSVASIGLCDTCIREKGGPVREYQGQRPIRHRHPTLDREAHEWHMHADFTPRHEHDQLGPEEEHAT